MSPIIRLAHSTFRSLRIRNYRLYFFGQIISMTGTWMQITAQMWLVLQLTGSGTALGVVTALQFIPVLLAGAWGGVVADRLDKRRALMVTQSSLAALAAALGAVTVAGIVELWMVYVLAFLMGCVLVIDVPTRQSFVTEMVGSEEVANAVGLNSTVFTSARFVGPAAAAAVISTVGIGWAFVLNAASFLAVIVGFARMNPGELHRGEPVGREKGQLLEGIRYVWKTPLLRGALLLMAVVGTLAFNFRVLLPLMAERVFNGDAATYGALSSVMGAGTVVGALIAASRARPTRALLVGSALAFGVLILTTAVAPTVPFAMAVLFPLGALSIIFVATANATLQINSTERMRGRVMALYSVVFLGSTPIGSPLVGWIAEQFGPRASFWVAGAATVAGGLIALAVVGRHRMRAAAALRGPFVDELPEGDAPSAQPSRGSDAAVVGLATADTPAESRRVAG